MDGTKNYIARRNGHMIHRFTTANPGVTWNLIKSEHKGLSVTQLKNAGWKVTAVRVHQIPKAPIRRYPDLRAMARIAAWTFFMGFLIWILFSIAIRGLV